MMGRKTSLKAGRDQRQTQVQGKEGICCNRLENEGEEEKRDVRQCDEQKIQTMGERRQKLMKCNSGIEAHGE